MDKILSSLRNTLEQSSDPKTKESAQRFFKEKIKVYGIKSNIVGKIGKEYFQKVKDLSKEEIFKYAEELFKSGYEEEAWIAAGWIYEQREKYEKEDIHIFKEWIDKYVDDWAKCDTFCNHSAAELIDKYPELLKELKMWAKSKNKWLRRASSVTLIIPARRGRYLKDIFEIADILLLDKEDMVQKGYGWMLKAASESHQKEIYEYVLSKRNIMPRTALRYAIEKMPAERKKDAMKRV